MLAADLTLFSTLGMISLPGWYVSKSAHNIVCAPPTFCRSSLRLINPNGETFARESRNLIRISRGA
jgi:hypothetical protein